jgi:hypothetical protein
MVNWFIFLENQPVVDHEKHQRAGLTRWNCQPLKLANVSVWWAAVAIHRAPPALSKWASPDYGIIVSSSPIFRQSGGGVKDGPTTCRIAKIVLLAGKLPSCRSLVPIYQQFSHVFTRHHRRTASI